MIYLLVLVGALTNTVVGQYDTKKQCDAAAHEYFAMLMTDKVSEKMKGKGLGCFAVPVSFPGPREMKES